jgi:Tfp pilus assembly protein FimT
MRKTRGGYTIIEMLMALCVAGTAAMMAIPKVSQTVSHTRVNQAAMLAQGDLERAASLAARERKPVRVTFNSSADRLEVTDRASGNQLWVEQFGLKTEFHIITFSSTPSYVDIYPNGTLSQPFTLTLGVTGYSRQITMSLAGQVRML